MKPTLTQEDKETDILIADLERYYAKRQKEGVPGASIRLARLLQPAFVRWIADERKRGTSVNEAGTAIVRVLPWMIIYAADALSDQDRSFDATVSTLMDHFHKELAGYLTNDNALAAMQVKGSA